MQSLPPDGGGHAELRHVAADRVGDLDALADQDRPGPVQHHHAPLFRRPHGTLAIRGQITLWDE
ncbi:MULTISPECIES: hypothetical protein [unclassified Brevundimonas]|uniref:hypothetical protein n=1 Tax=unclassified Brevundimonas TaxID=2622653 RepID=UPI003916DC80